MKALALSAVLFTMSGAFTGAALVHHYGVAAVLVLAAAVATATAAAAAMLKKE